MKMNSLRRASWPILVPEEIQNLKASYQGNLSGSLPGIPSMPTEGKHTPRIDTKLESWPHQSEILGPVEGLLDHSKIAVV